MTRTTMSLLVALSILILHPTSAYADFWGGDLPLLATIVSNTAEQLTKLQSILGKSAETLQLLKDINRGVRDAMVIIQTHNTTLSPGLLADMRNVSDVIKFLEGMYGRIPKTFQSNLQAFTDTNIAESINLHNEAFRYAEKIDPEAEKIKKYAENVNPLGAQKLSAQALGVLIHVMNQILRTNAALLKVQSVQLALENRREKASSEQFKAKYEELSNAFRTLNPDYGLPRLTN